MAPIKKTVILGITGSIAAYKACDIINILKRDGLDCVPVLTPEAKEFITPLTLETLSGNKVVCDMFALPEAREPIHISLADRASCIAIAPASANIIGKLANGICDDILTCVVLASKAPCVIAPAMNENMYEHPSVVENIKKLKKMGYKFVGPVKGRLMCGRKGMGHIASPEEIAREIKNQIK